MRAGLIILAATSALCISVGSASAQSTSFQPGFDNSGNGITSLTGSWRNTAEYPNNSSERGGSSSGGVTLFEFGANATPGLLPAPNAPTALSLDTEAAPVTDSCVRRNRKGVCLR